VQLQCSCKEARRVKPWLVTGCTGVAGAGGGPAGVEEDVEEHQDTNIACVAGTRYRTEDGSSARCHVDQPRTQIKRKGNSGDGLHNYNTQAQV
jgi:hypothetical protein